MQQRSGPAHHERRAAKAMTRALEEIELVGRGDDTLRQGGNVLQRVGDFVHVIDDELLRAELGDAVQVVLPDTAHIAVDTFIQRKQQSHVVAVHAQSAKLVQTTRNVDVIVVLARVGLFPRAHSGAAIMVGGGRFPRLVTRGFGHSTLDLGKLSVGASPRCIGFGHGCSRAGSDRTPPHRRGGPDEPRRQPPSLTPDTPTQRTGGVQMGSDLQLTIVVGLDAAWPLIDADPSPARLRLRCARVRRESRQLETPVRALGTIVN